MAVTILGCSPGQTWPQATVHTDDGDVTIDLDVVDTPVSRQKGLMYWESLDEDRGMLFVWEEEQPLAFWMKNTLIPLDMIFIDRNWMIVDIIKDVPPCENDPCQSYPTVLPAQYVIEVNAGFTAQHGITIGHHVDFLEP